MSSKKKDFKIYIPLTAVVFLVIVASVYWYIDYSSYVKTDDAYVTSDVVQFILFCILSTNILTEMMEERMQNKMNCTKE